MSPWGGGGNRIRTGDPLLAGQVLYQLSYTPKMHNLKFNQSNYADVMILQTPLSLLSSQRYESILCIMATVVRFERTIHRIKICCLKLLGYTAILKRNLKEHFSYMVEEVRIELTATGL